MDNLTRRDGRCPGGTIWPETRREGVAVSEVWVCLNMYRLKKTSCALCKGGLFEIAYKWGLF